MKEYDFYSTPIDLNIDANGNIFTTIALSLSLSLSLSLHFCIWAWGIMIMAHSCDTTGGKH